MYLYLHVSETRADFRRLFRNAFLDYNARVGLGLSRHAAETAPLATGPYGKPYFADIPNACFSISHSGRFWACLMAGADLGLDAEDLAFRRARNAGREGGAVARYLKLARRYFSEDERHAAEEAAELEPDELTERFFFIWTRKEAYLKYTGRGLGVELGGFSVLDGGLGVSFGAVGAWPGLALSYCGAKEDEIRDIIFY